MTQISITTTPKEYFREQLVAKAEEMSLPLKHNVEFYIVNLLCEFVDITRLDSVLEGWDLFDAPLALMYKKAMESPPSQQMKCFKRIGDVSLYIAGFFEEYFNRKTFDIKYYIDFGSSAYGSAARVVASSGTNTFVEVYEDMATHFQSYVDVVAGVSMGGQKAPQDILCAYERWSKTGSERLRRVLEESGISPVPSTVTRVPQ